MATDLTGLDMVLQILLAGTAVKENDLTEVSDPVSLTQKYTNTFGTAANQSNTMYHARTEIGEAASVSLDLTALTNSFGVVTGFTKIRGLLIINTSDQLSVPTDARLEIGDAAATANKWSAPFKAGTEVLLLEVGQPFLITEMNTAGLTVDATHKLLKLTNADVADHAQFDIYVWGVAA